MRKTLAVLTVLLMAPLQYASAFDLLADIQANTNWTLGNSIAAGTAIALRDEDAYNLKNGQFVGSALAQVVNYRFLSAWGGGNFIPQPDGTLRAIDTGKIGFNCAYFFKGFANQPPDLIKNLVIGPSVMMPLWTTPHKAVPFIDINYAFGGTKEINVKAPANVPPTSKLNLLYEVPSV